MEDKAHISLEALRHRYTSIPLLPCHKCGRPSKYVQVNIEAGFEGMDEGQLPVYATWKSSYCEEHVWANAKKRLMHVYANPLVVWAWVENQQTLALENQDPLKVEQREKEKKELAGKGLVLAHSAPKGRIYKNSSESMLCVLSTGALAEPCCVLEAARLIESSVALQAKGHSEDCIKKSPGIVGK